MNFDFSTLQNEFVLVVFVACLIVGYLIKHTFDFVPNKYIPTLLALLGAILNCFVGGITLNTIVYGALMGLASTGMHQAFTRFIENLDTEK